MENEMRLELRRQTQLLDKDLQQKFVTDLQVNDTTT
jgi:hypothetical protein